MFTRRHLLTAAAVLPLAPLLASCGTSTANTTVAQYIDAVSRGLKAVLGKLPLSGSTLARYNTDIDKLTKLATDVINGTMSGASAASQAIAAVEDALSLFGSNLPASVQVYLAAIETVLAILQGFLGTSAQAAAGQRHTMQMTEAQAMAILR